MPDEMVTAYQTLYRNKSLDQLMWFITRVMPIIHIASQARKNCHQFAFIKGSPTLYSSIVTSSNEAFALFLLKHYRSPPLAKEYKPKVRGPKYITSAKQKKQYKKQYKQQNRTKDNYDDKGEGNDDRGNNDDNKDNDREKDNNNDNDNDNNNNNNNNNDNNDEKDNDDNKDNNSDNNKDDNKDSDDNKKITSTMIMLTMITTTKQWQVQVWESIKRKLT